MTNIAMENNPFIDGLPIKHGGSFHGYVSLPEGNYHLLSYENVHLYPMKISHDQVIVIMIIQFVSLLYINIYTYPGLWYTYPSEK